MDPSILHNNLAHLPGSLQDLLSQHVSSSSVDVMIGKQGWPVGRIQNDKNVISTNSLVDPWKEASEWAASLDYKDVMVSIIYGTGFGYPLLEYAKRKQPYTETIVFEENIDLLSTLLSRLDMRPVLMNPAIHFVVGDIHQMNDQIKDVFTPDFLLRATRPAFFFTWLSHRNHKQTYLSIHEWVCSTLQLNISSIGNSVHDTLVGLYNMIDNVPHVLRSPRLSEFRNAFANKPAFIVANGPSLDKNVEWLSQVKGRALILAAESSLKPCLKRNIEPDAVCVVERTPSSYTVHFQAANLPDNITLVGLSLMDPRIPPEFPGRWIPVFRGFESTSQWISESIGCDAHELSGGGSSAHLAFEFALWCGANPVVFVGQDLAFGPNRATHSQFSSYSEEYFAQQVRILQSQPVFMVKGVDGNLVSTIKIWYEFKTWFERQIVLHPEVTFIDATEGGAYIEGTQLMTLQETIAMYCKNTLTCTLGERMKGIPSSGEGDADKGKYETLIRRMSRIRVTCQELASSVDEDIRRCKMVLRACELQRKHGGVLPSFVESMVQTNTQAFRKYGSDEDIVTFTQQVIFAMHRQINSIGEIDTVDRLVEVTRLQRQMFEYLKNICIHLVAHFGLAEHRARSKMPGQGEPHDLPAR